MVDEFHKDVIQSLMNKRKTKTIIADPESKGRTNATNPTSINVLMVAYDRLNAATTIPVEAEPALPALRAIPVAENFKIIGENLGICPHELEAIFDHDITSDNELVVSAFKKLISAIKISCEIDLSPVRKRLDHNRKENEQRREWHRQACERVQAANSNRTRIVDSAFANFTQAWGSILIDLVQKVDANSQLSSLGEWDRLMCLALVEISQDPRRNSKQVAALSDRDKVTIDFKAAKDLPASIISSLPKIAREIKAREQLRAFNQWLTDASDHELHTRFWNTTDTDEHDCIAMEIADRRRVNIDYDEDGFPIHPSDWHHDDYLSEYAALKNNERMRDAIAQKHYERVMKGEI